jgi:hypothetical protein
VANYILADCVVCNRVTDAIDGDEAPVCQRCSDRGLSGKILAGTLQAHIDEAKERRANGETVKQIAKDMGVGRRTVYYWLRKS